MKLRFGFLAFACSAALSLAAADFAPADVLVYTRWQYVRNPKTNVVVPKGAFHHFSTEEGAKQIEKYFTAKGVKCLVTDKPEVFTSAAMKSIKCVMFQCSNHEQFATDAQRGAFYDWVKRGGGVVAIHSSSANERGRKEWREFLGGSFERHYARHQSVPFRHADRTHPAIACLPADYVWADDEVYLNHPADSVRPLLILDWNDVLPESRKGDKWGCPPIGGHVLEWCKTFGKGRIYYTALGHNPQDFAKPEFLLHLLTAAKWSMGQLPDRVVDPNPPSLSKAKVETTIEGARLVKDGQVVWQLNLANRENKPFIHPLCLPDGRCITAARPADHPWHLGLWFCWKYINGLNYWEPRNPSTGNLFPDGMTVVRDFKIAPKGAACNVEVALWYGPRNEPGRVLLDEKREIAFTAPDAKGCYKIFSKHVFTAREKVTFDCRRPIGYGGFSLRMCETMRGCIRKGTGGDTDAKKNIAGPKGMTAVTYTGPSSGHGVRMTALAPLPTERIYTWANNGFVNPVPMYEKPLVLEKGQTITLSYEVDVF